MRQPRGVEAMVGEVDGDAVLHVHVQPRAARTQLRGRRGDTLHVRVSPPAVDGRATDAARRVVADCFRLATSRVVLVSGERSREKRFRLVGIDREEAVRLLEAILTEAGTAAEP